MTTKLKYLVGGEWKDTTSGNYYEITNSSTGEVMALAPRCTAEEVEERPAETAHGWRRCMPAMPPEV